ncbi:unnamed protein product [Adineta steineri]|uniref:G-protein coupled receptors family 1 profile domain-containing protein n=1 Tax=Adineta steineri TaxID=433720 RepID=A0A819M3C3_9BILA|nr:unnamed protein product [Adineta steineri]CAF3973088.1 unnamed protein product [Adineta steineri]
MSIIHAIFFSIYYDTRSNVCTIINPKFAKYYSYVYIPVVIGILPIIKMITFALLAFISIRSIASRNIHIERLGRDRQLTAMTLIYVVFIMFFYYVRNQVIYVLIDVHFKRFQQAANNLNNHQVTPGIEMN